MTDTPGGPACRCDPARRASGPSLRSRWKGARHGSSAMVSPGVRRLVTWFVMVGCEGGHRHRAVFQRGISANQCLVFLVSHICF
ncbi:Hypothetical protein GbCGDNIH8_8667 [Granulibacter bethesdensis]|nr:Hypothetical protein GbCGDNIH8_8667 [Granulibacter bethesdensis]